MKRIAFLVSGSGTNMENLIKRIQAGKIRAEAAIVISNLEKAPARADWNARTPGGQFACNSDERFALPECRKVGE